MQAEHRIALALVDVVHPQPVLVCVLRLEREVRERREAIFRRAVDAHRGPGTPRNSYAQRLPAGLHDPRLPRVVGPRSHEHGFGYLLGLHQRDAFTLDPLPQLGRDDRRVDEPRTDRVDADAPLGKVGGDRAHVADDGMFRERVDRIRGHRHEARERGRGDDRAAGRHDLLHSPYAEHDTVDVCADHPPVAGEVVPRAADAGVEEREVRAVHVLPGVRVGDVETGREVE